MKNAGINMAMHTQKLTKIQTSSIESSWSIQNDTKT